MTRAALHISLAFLFLALGGVIAGRPVEVTDEVTSASAKSQGGSQWADSVQDSKTRNLEDPRGKICEICKKFAVQVSVIVSDPAFTTEAIAAVEASLCLNLEGDLQEECDKLVEQYVPAVVEQLEQELTPNTLCISTKICKRTVDLLPAVVAKALGGPQDCAACRILVKLIRKKLQDPTSQEHMERFLLESCARITEDKLSQECQEAVYEYLPVIFANLDVILDPSLVCQKAGMCPRHGLFHLPQGSKAADMAAM